MTFPETDAEKTWAGAVGAALLALVGGSLLFPRTVYAGFVWQYFWGPVYADAHSAYCAAYRGGTIELLQSAAACRGAAGVVAYPGYTAVSEVGYALTLIVAVTGIVFLLRRLDVGDSLSMLYALFPFMLFGGALRVVEDANDTVPAGVDPFVQYPLNALIISPLIYFTVFAITLVSLVASVFVARRDLVSGVDSYERPLFAAGSAALLLTVGYLSYLSATTTYVEFHPLITVVSLVGATLATGIVWWLTTRYTPEVHLGTEKGGALIIWGHAVDGVSNYVGIDWAAELGLRADLVPKHPVNRAVIGFARDVTPMWLQHYIGVSWSFMLLKLVAATFVVWLFNDEMFEENPRYTVLLLVAVLAVGLGPGTRDMLRATFGV
ncbi:DUF63 family protein [Halospeciosus flavus]|uniref:DUF63 family protein n=1 Tax=Halospeciosus flavus TaxID=3032283 RepID=A0ABD5Z1J9_9EURY|nr:DUF63 family protein [Halospeciosus flavus]